MRETTKELRGVLIDYKATDFVEEIKRLASGIRDRFRGMATIVLYMLASLFRPGRRKIGVYSIQRRMWARHDDFRTYLTILFALLNERKIKLLIAARLPLADVRKAHEMLADSGVKGKPILLGGGPLVDEGDTVICGG